MREPGGPVPYRKAERLIRHFELGDPIFEISAVSRPTRLHVQTTTIAIEAHSGGVNRARIPSGVGDLNMKRGGTHKEIEGSARPSLNRLTFGLVWLDRASGGRFRAGFGYLTWPAQVKAELSPHLLQVWVCSATLFANERFHGVSWVCSV